MAVLNKEKLQAGFARAFEDVPLSEFGGEAVRLQAPTAGRVLQLRKEVTRVTKEGGDPESLTPAMVAECLVDEAGVQLFANGDGESFVLGLSTPSFLKLQHAIARLMGASDDEIEAAEKN